MFSDNYESQNFSIPLIKLSYPFIMYNAPIVI